jgi:undecaprenyl-diphosphatase
MNIFESVVLGLTQGVTEFLPISSTGHLWILEELIFQLESSIALEIFFHAATLLAVIAFFWKRIWSLSKNLILPKGDSSEKIFALKLILATGITGVLGIVLKDSIEENINTTVVAITLFITGIFILISEYFSPKNKKQFSWTIAIFLGIVQAVALLPGISRSGITIVFLLLAGLGKKQSLEISFLLSIPTILGAFIFLLPEISEYPADIQVLTIGGIAAFFAAFLTIWLMMNHITRVWKWFSLWCFGVGTALFFI